MSLESTLDCGQSLPVTAEKEERPPSFTGELSTGHLGRSSFILHSLPVVMQWRCPPRADRQVRRSPPLEAFVAGVFVEKLFPGTEILRSWFLC